MTMPSKPVLILGGLGLLAIAVYYISKNVTVSGVASGIVNGVTSAVSGATSAIVDAANSSSNPLQPVGAAIGGAIYDITHIFSPNPAVQTATIATNTASGSTATDPMTSILSGN